MKKVKLEGGWLLHGDCLRHMTRMKPHSVDLVVGSPPYEDARTYGIEFNLKGQDWVDWMVEVFEASLRVCKGLVAFVVEGRTVDYKWSAAPVLLMADLHRKGICLRKPPIYKRDGVPGSGRDDWLKNKYEFIVCATNGGKLPWSDNTACGHKPKYELGGECSHRNRSGARANFSVQTRRIPNGRRAVPNAKDKIRKLPNLANPGNIIDCKDGATQIESDIGYENEAPFPDKLPRFFIRSFCPPGGVVYDPFGGSGTTPAEAVKWGRRFIASDVRESQIKLMTRRLKEAWRLRDTQLVEEL